MPCVFLLTVTTHNAHDTVALKIHRTSRNEDALKEKPAFARVCAKGFCFTMFTSVTMAHIEFKYISTLNGVSTLETIYAIFP